MRSIPRFSSIEDAIEPLNRLTDNPSAAIPKEYTLRLLRYLEREPIQRLENMGRYLLNRAPEVIRIDQAMFAQYDAWYTVHQARSTNLAYAMRMNWAQAGLIAGWNFQNIEEVHTWLTPALAGVKVLQGSQLRAFSEHLAGLCHQSSEAFEFCAVIALQMVDSPRWATQLDWRQHAPGVSCTFVALRALDDMRNPDTDARQDGRLQLDRFRSWWPDWVKEIEQLHILYESVYGEDSSAAATRLRAETIAARNKTADVWSIPEGHSL